jgi:hypothetical protein
MTRLRLLPLLLLLVPATAHANGLGALGTFVAFLLLLTALSGAICLGLTIASAVIGRKSAPPRPWKRTYAVIAIVVTSLCGLILLPLSVLAFILLFDVSGGADTILFLGVILCGALGVASLWLSIRVLRRNPKA